ncbi:MAG: hypothetical protein ACM3OC_02630 [Deltaproteobacteria bacterium]
MKNRFLVILLVVDLAVLVLLLGQRQFSHLLLWDIRESFSRRELERPPEKAAEYFRFESRSDAEKVFDKTVTAVKESGLTAQVLGMAARIEGMEPSVLYGKKAGAPPIKWDSPEGLARQLKEGARGAHCLHRSIVLAEACAAAGIPARLWALENRDFDGVPHTVIEAYDAAGAKWVFFDPQLCFYALSGDAALSLLDLRERLLNGKTEGLEFVRMDNGQSVPLMASVYRPMLRKVFLRSRNDFSRMYRDRYGFFRPLSCFIDPLPVPAVMGIYYLFSGDRFIHYVDRFDGRLRGRAKEVKAVFLLLTAVFFAGCAAFFALRKRRP